MPKTKTLVPIERIENKIYLIRNHKVMIDTDLAMMYGVTVKRLNEQVRRNITRFPKDFIFQLTKSEYDFQRSQIATFEKGKGRYRKYLPYAFTEHGAVMLASVLNSRIAVEASIQVVRAFVKLREVLSTHKELATKFQLLENKFDKHDDEIQALFEAIRQLMETPNPPRRKIGYKRYDGE
ncbi:MAG: ORF6N domain-containing protein [Bacteroidetes bacterium]|nr:ORF6N domain-containing protein [Bacteroidota bacterium]